MNRRKRRFLSSLLLASIMTIAMSFQAFAARIAFSDPSGQVGDEITVTMKITATGDETINSSDVMLSYDSSALEFVSGTGATGGAGSIRVVGTADSQDSTELSFTLKFNALKAGNSQITISTQEVYDKDSQLVEIDREGSSTVTVTGRSTDSSDATLAQLKISPGSLSPSFSPDVDTYTATVSGDVSEIVVSAPSSNDQASVSISGNTDLQLGENEVVCTVTAQDGQTVKTYTILVTKVEGSADGDETSTEGVALKTPERNLTVLPIEEGLEIPEGFRQCTISIDGQDVEGWVWDADTDPQYCVFYAMNEDGEKGFYRYDLTEKTLQRYFSDPTGSDSVSMEQYTATAEEYNSLLHDYNIRFWIIIGLIALSVVLLIVIIILIATRGPKDDFIERRRDDTDFPERREKKNAEHRKVSREERYMRGLEIEEEEAAREEARFRQTERRTERQMKARLQEKPERPAPSEPKADKGVDDGDFEVVDLDI